MRSTSPSGRWGSTEAPGHDGTTAPARTAPAGRRGPVGDLCHRLARTVRDVPGPGARRDPHTALQVLGVHGPEKLHRLPLAPHPRVRGKLHRDGPRSADVSD